MKYRNYEVGFTFEVPDVFSEVKQSSYNVFDVPEDTMHYFICLDENGDIIRSFSMVKDGPCNSDEDFNNIVKNVRSTYSKLLQQLWEFRAKWCRFFFCPFVKIL